MVDGESSPSSMEGASRICLRGTYGPPPLRTCLCSSIMPATLQCGRRGLVWRRADRWTGIRANPQRKIPSICRSGGISTDSDSACDLGSIPHRRVDSHFSDGPGHSTPGLSKMKLVDPEAQRRNGLDHDIASVSLTRSLRFRLD